MSQSRAILTRWSREGRDVRGIPAFAAGEDRPLRGAGGRSPGIVTASSSRNWQDGRRDFFLQCFPVAFVAVAGVARRGPVWPGCAYGHHDQRPRPPGLSHARGNRRRRGGAQPARGSGCCRAGARSDRQDLAAPGRGPAGPAAVTAGGGGAGLGSAWRHRAHGCHGLCCHGVGGPAARRWSCDHRSHRHRRCDLWRGGRSRHECGGASRWPSGCRPSRHASRGREGCRG